MSTYILYSSELYHHGVKGMKWGVRKAQKKEARAERRATRQAERDAIRAAKGRTKTKGQRMAGRIILGVATDISYGMLGAMGQRALMDRGHDAAAAMLGYAVTGASVANTIQTVKDAVKIGKDSRDRW